MLVEHPVLAGLAVLCVVAALIWGRSSRRLLRASRRMEAYVNALQGGGQESADLARSAFRKEVHTSVLYATQGATDPPTFTLFTNRQLPAPYLRYLERKIREHFAFGPTPLKLRVRRRAG